MNIKALTMTALLGVFLAGSSAQAWPNSWHGYNKHHYHKPVKKHYYKKVIKHVYVQPSTYHTHPANGLTNDTYHQHPNGLNHHVHNYGAGGHKHGGHSYSICPYPH